VEIGKPRRTYTIEPLKSPVPERKEPVPQRPAPKRPARPEPLRQR
jgi:hypothetical protein